MEKVLSVYAFVKRVNRGYSHTQYEYTSAGDVPAIGDVSSSKKALKLSKGYVLPPEGTRIT